MSLESVRRPRVMDRRSVDNNLLPWRHFCTADRPLDYAKGMIAQRVNLNGWWFQALSWTDGLGNGLGWNFYLAAGTWEIYPYVMKRSDYPISQLHVDGTPFGASFDMYSATTGFFLPVPTQPLVVAQAGLKQITLRAVGKNPSSVGYVNVLCGMSLVRTA